MAVNLYYTQRIRGFQQEKIKWDSVTNFTENSLHCRIAKYLLYAILFCVI